MKILTRLLFLLLLLPSVALARTEICGDGIDNDGTGGDLARPGLDGDDDGYDSAGTGRYAGIDCDNSNRYIRPGTLTSFGCSAGSFRKCQTDGTYTSCTALSSSTYANFPGCSALFFIDAPGNTSSGAGSYATPMDWRCFSNSSLACYHAPVAGDCFAMLSSAPYTSSWSDGTNNHHIYVFNKDGTITNHVQLFAAPGHTWWEKGAGAGVFIKGAGTFSPKKEVVPVQIYESNYWDVRGLEITTNTGGFSNSGIEMVGPGTGGNTFDNYIHNIDGEEDNNLTCIKYRGNQNSIETGWNILANCHEQLSTTGDAGTPGSADGWNSPNNSNWRAMDCDDFWVHDNVVYSTASASIGMSIKHGAATATGGRFNNNKIFDMGFAGLEIDGWPNITIDHNFLDGNANYLMETGSISQGDLGSPMRHYSNMVIKYNTILNGPCFGSKAHSDQHSFDTNILNAHHNICVDNRATAYPGDGSDGFMRLNYYGSDADFTSWQTKVQIDNNCYYNSAGTTLYFTLFGASGGPYGSLGGNYSGFAAWQAGTIFDDNSFNENPVINSYGIATSSNCLDKGWNVSEGTTTTTTTTTTLPGVIWGLMPGVM